MRSHLLRWALKGITAVTALTFACAGSPALAAPRRTVVIGPGDSIDSLARRYHVPIKDIARANHISPRALLVDGRKLVIPSPPKAALHPETMHKRAWVKGDRISIRLGPDEGARRLTLLDHGVPLTATARQGDWVQVHLSSGSAGWIRSDFVKLGGAANRGAERASSRRQVASATHARRSRLARAEAESNSAGPRRRARVRAEKQREEAYRHRERLARRHRLEQLARSEAQRHLAASRRQVRRQIADRRSPSWRSHARPESTAPDANSDVVRTAYAYRGTPYSFGGSGRRGFDCSGFTSYVYSRKGVNLPHSAAEQFGRGRRIDSGHLKEGDLVFFHTTRRGISHVGIYAGNGKFVHASSAGGRVRVDSLSSGYYRERFRGARRVR